METNKPYIDCRTLRRQNLGTKNQFKFFPHRPITVRPPRTHTGTDRRPHAAVSAAPDSSCFLYVCDVTGTVTWPPKALRLTEGEKTRRLIIITLIYIPLADPWRVFQLHGGRPAPLTAPYKPRRAPWRTVGGWSTASPTRSLPGCCFAPGAANVCCRARDFCSPDVKLRFPFWRCRRTPPPPLTDCFFS